MTAWHLILMLWRSYLVVAILLQLSFDPATSHRHDDKYSFWFIFRSLGRPPFGPIVRQPSEQLEPLLRGDLERMQQRAFLWQAAMSINSLLVILSWVALSKGLGTQPLISCGARPS